MAFFTYPFIIFYRMNFGFSYTIYDIHDVAYTIFNYPNAEVAINSNGIILCLCACEQDISGTPSLFCGRFLCLLLMQSHQPRILNFLSKHFYLPFDFFLPNCLPFRPSGGMNVLLSSRI